MRWLLIVTALGLAALATACSDGSDGADLKTFLAGPTPLSREAAIDKLRTMVEGTGNYYAFGCISWPDAEVDVCAGLAPGDLDRVAAGLPLSTDGIWAANGHERLWSVADSDCGYGGTNRPNHPHLRAIYDLWHPGHIADFREVELAGRTCLIPQ